jgi:tetratricopeptide (TPR) repeat protein
VRHGVRHPETLRIQRELASLYRDQSRFAEAEPLLRGILASLEGDSAMQSPFALETTNDLGYAIYQLGRFQEAESILRSVLERQRALFGEINASALNTMRALGSSVRDQGRLDEAEQLYRTALRVAHALYGEEHEETETVMYTLALALERKYDLEAAAELAQRDVALAERLYGSDNFRMLGRRMLVAVLQLERGDLAAAERSLRQVKRHTRAVSPSRGTDDGDVLNRLAYLLLLRGAPDAAQAYREAVAFDDSRPTGQADFVSDGLHYLAWCEHRMGDLAASEHDYQRALAVYERYLPAGHPFRTAASEGLTAVRAARSRSR